MRDIGHHVQALLHACSIEREIEPETVDVVVTLDAGRVLSGTVGGVRGSAILSVSYSTLAAKHRLTAWVRYLAVVASTDDASYRAVTVGRNRDNARRSILFGVSPTSSAVPPVLLQIRDAGLCEPLPIALETSEQYATRRHRGDDVADAVLAARRPWEPTHSPGA
jgi:exodeoxyribonuclease V gamma subunit